MEPKLIADYRCQTGEGPLWHPEENCVYWLDIATPGRMFRYDCATGKHEQVYEGEAVGGFTLQADGALLLFGAKGSVRIWRKGQLTTVIDEIPEERETRFNDVFADTMGRVYCGTMPLPNRQRLGRLYRLDTDGKVTKVLDDIGCSNGMGFTPDRKRMYYTDSTKLEIYLFDYDAATGNLSNQRVFVRTPQGEGVPDGMTVDAQGYVWSARWDGGHLFRFAPDGHEVLRVKFPAKKVSCVTFGGADYTDMYVTCAGGTRKKTEGLGAGALFYLNLGIRGVPECRSRIGL
jgi:D-xylono/L-arabinono-1,4-lactonase